MGGTPAAPERDQRGGGDLPLSSRKQRSNGNPRRAPQKEPHREAISGSPGRDGSTWPFEDSGRRFEQIQNAEAQEGGRAGQDAERWIGKTGDSECKRRWEARLRGWCPGRPVGGHQRERVQGLVCGSGLVPVSASLQRLESPFISQPSQPNEKLGLSHQRGLGLDKPRLSCRPSAGEATSRRYFPR